MRIQTRPHPNNNPNNYPNNSHPNHGPSGASVSAREANDSSPFLGVSNNSNGSSFRSDLSRSGEGGYIYLVEVQYYLRLHTGQVSLSLTSNDLLLYCYSLILVVQNGLNQIE